MWRRTPSLRERFRVAGLDFFSDQEVLELAFLSVMTAGKARRLARLLMDRFKNFSDVVEAPREELQTVPGMTDDAMFRLAIIKATTYQLVHGPVCERPNLSKRSAVLEYLAQTPAPKSAGLRVLFLDKKGRLIEDKYISPVTVKAVIHAALQCGAMGLVPVDVDPATAEAIDDAGAPLKVTVLHFFPLAAKPMKNWVPSKEPAQADYDAPSPSVYREPLAEFGPEKKSTPKRQEKK